MATEITIEDEEFARTADGEKTTTRAMVPVLLCFDVEHAVGATEEQVAERIRQLVTHNLGEIGAEENEILFNFEDEQGNDLDAALYPSDHDWCNTMEHARPNRECSVPDPNASRADAGEKPRARLEVFTWREPGDDEDLMTINVLGAEDPTQTDEHVINEALISDGDLMDSPDGRKFRINITEVHPVSTPEDLAALAEEDVEREGGLCQK